MEIGFVGLGRMGLNMVRRVAPAGHRVVAWDRNAGPVGEAVQAGARGAASLADLVQQLTPPRAVWIMIPAGNPTESTIAELAELCTRGDVVIDGGNSYYRDSMRRAETLRARGIHFVDAGTSGGIWGLTVGYCLMVGGEADAVNAIRSVLETLAPKDGFAHVGPSGAGHFVKMVHNGIEYGMLQAYAEGFEIMERSRFSLDLHAIAALWNHGSVVRSWMLELAERAFANDTHLADIAGYVEDSGEGRWTVQEAMELDVPAPIITLSLLARFRSRQQESFSAKVIAALRKEFGGHAVRTATDGEAHPVSASSGRGEAPSRDAEGRMRQTSINTSDAGRAKTSDGRGRTSAPRAGDNARAASSGRTDAGRPTPLTDHSAPSSRSAGTKARTMTREHTGAGRATSPSDYSTTPAREAGSTARAAQSVPASAQKRGATRRSPRRSR
jgi:6-phosphogluconate dehydrogenase